LDAIAHIALSIRFIDTLSTAAPDSAEARKELSKAILAGDITRIIVTKSNMVNGEEAVVCALLQSFRAPHPGIYFPEEWLQIQKIVQNDQEGETAQRSKLLVCRLMRSLRKLPGTGDCQRKYPIAWQVQRHSMKPACRVQQIGLRLWPISPEALHPCC